MKRVKGGTREPWERKHGETEKAFEAFLIYKNLGPGRTQIDVAQKLSKSVSLIRRWASEWEWKNRVIAWDSDVEQKAKEEAQKELKAMILRHIKIGMKIQEKGLKGLDHLDPKRMGAISVREFLDFGTKLEREARALITQSEQDDGKKKGAAEIHVYIPDNGRD